MGPARNFTFLAPKQDLDSENYDKNGPDIISISVEGYIWKMIPENCFKNTTFTQPLQFTKLFIDGKLESNRTRANIDGAKWTINEFTEGQNFTI